MIALNMQVKTLNQEVNVINTAVAKQHIEMVLNHAQTLGAKGKMVLCSYGQDPETGVKQKPHVVHLTIGEDNSEKMNEFIEYVKTTPHSNGYMGLQVYDESLPPGKRGTKKDIRYILGMVADHDSLEGKRWKQAMVEGLDPTYVVESSPGNYQTTFLFSELVKPDDCVKPFAAMERAMADDNCTKDIAHVWRIPGLPNRVNAKKAKAGREDSESNLVLENGPEWTIKGIWEKVKSYHIEITKIPLNKVANGAVWDGNIPAMVMATLEQEVKIGSRSEVMWKGLFELIKLGLNDDEIIGVFYEYEIGEKFREKGTNEKWLQKQIDKARGKYITAEQIESVLNDKIDKQQNKESISEPEYQSLIKLIASTSMGDTEEATVITKIKQLVPGVQVDKIRKAVKQERDSKWEAWRRKQEKKGKTKADPVPDPKTLREITDRYVFISEPGKYYDICLGTTLTTSSLMTTYAKLIPGTNSMARKETLTTSIGHESFPSLVSHPGNTDIFITNPITGTRSMNIWRLGWMQPDEVKVSEKDVKPWLDLMEHNIPEDKVREHTIDWFAFAVQHPEHKINHQILWTGEFQIGKDTCIQPIYQHFRNPTFSIDPTVEGDALEEGFQDFLKNKKLIVFQEIKKFGDAGNIENKMKNLLTAPPDTISINPKGFPRTTVTNVVLIIAMSNFPVPVKITKGSDRWFLIDSLDVKPNKKLTRKVWEFYNFDKIRGISPGMISVLNYLKQRDISAFDYTARAPVTKAAAQAALENETMLTPEIRNGIIRKAWPFKHPIVTLAQVDRWLQGMDKVGDMTFQRKRNKPTPPKTIGEALRENDYTQRRMTIDKKERQVWIRINSRYKNYTAKETGELWEDYYDKPCRF